jgi:proline iminopeptidase
MTPDKFTISEKFLDVSDGHQLYVYEWGNPKATTKIICLHGGPGGGIKDRHKGSFDPEIHHVIFFDQRGCGKSLPSGSREHNTTQKLIEDITKIADTYGFEQFVVRGNSWGSCLALAYALAEPKRVKALVIGGVFTGNKSEIDWLDKGGFKVTFPDVWQTYLDATPKNHQDNPTEYHTKRALGEDPIAAKESAYTYDCLEGAIMSLDDTFTPDDFEKYDPAGMQIEMYYLHNGCFMPDRYILDNAHKLTMPIYIVQGRYDTVCPPVTAYELSHKAPNTKLIWTIANHRGEHEDNNLFRTILASL